MKENKKGVKCPDLKGFTGFKYFLKVKKRQKICEKKCNEKREILENYNIMDGINDSICIELAGTDEEFCGRGYVQYTSWQEAYRGIVVTAGLIR